MKVHVLPDGSHATDSVFNIGDKILRLENVFCEHEWKSISIWGGPPPHLVDDYLAIRLESCCDCGGTRLRLVPHGLEVIYESGDPG